MHNPIFNVTVEQCACQQTAPDTGEIIAAGQTFFFTVTTSATAKSVGHARRRRSGEDRRPSPAGRQLPAARTLLHETSAGWSPTER
ncbi:hypothetical protein M8494_21780 [Serratia ureilytica]